MANVLLVNQGLDTTNWGLQASSRAIIDIISESQCVVGSITHKELHREFIFEPRILGRKIFNDNSRLLQKTMPQYLCFPQTSDEYEYYYELWLAGRGGYKSKEFMEAITAADIVFFNAEGSTYKKNRGALVGLFLLYIACRLGKRAIFANGSFTITCVDNVLTGIARRLYIEGVEFYVREGLSQKCLEEAGVSSKVIPDSVFYYAENSCLQKENTFAVSKSMLPMCMTDVRDDAFLDIIRQVSLATGLSPVFYAIDPEDLVIRRYLSVLRDSKMICSASSDFRQVQIEISKSRFILSGRYHHLIFAANTGTHVCPMSSSSLKVEGLMRLLDPRDPPICNDPTNLRMDESKIVGQCVLLLEQAEVTWNPLELKRELLSSYRDIFS